MTWTILPVDDGLRSAMRLLPSPVVVITAGGKDTRRGATVGSFTYLSNTPPLVLFCLRENSRLLGVIGAAEHFTVHIFDSHHVSVVRRFSAPGTSHDQFVGLAVEEGEHGTPILTDAAAILTARSSGRIRRGDHAIVTGTVVDVRKRHGGSPLVYYDREYRELGDRVDTRVPLNEVSTATTLDVALSAGAGVDGGR